MLDISIDSTKKNFIKYLDILGISPKSHKNYRSDLNHFMGWLIVKIRSFGSGVETLTEAVPFLDKNIVNEYRTHLIKNKTPGKSINRRLSTLRHLAKFLLAEQVIESNFMEDVVNISLPTQKVNNTKTSLTPLVDDFQSYLVSEKSSKNTIKNYTSDVRQFLVWLESQRVPGSQF